MNKDRLFLRVGAMRRQRNCAQSLDALIPMGRRGGRLGPHTLSGGMAIAWPFMAATDATRLAESLDLKRAQQADKRITFYSRM